VLFLDTFFEPFAEVLVGGNPSSVVPSPDGSRVYVSNANRGVIDVLDTDSQTIVNSIAVASGVTNLALSSSGSTLAALIPATGEVAHIDLVTSKVVSLGQVASDPTGLTFGADDRALYVSDRGSNAVLSVDLNYRLPGSPLSVQVRPSGNGVTVSWKAPSVQGTAPIVRYQVSSIPKAGTCVTTKRACSIKGLKAGRTYRFEVVAQTAHAKGKPARTRPVRIPTR
jgi:DNA-binding beta-propeller fold protein YncE